MSRAILAGLLVLSAVGSASEGTADPGGADCGDEPPRTAIVAFDGVPFRVVQQVHAAGDFGAWPEPVPLVSTFPSLTNVAFTAIFAPLGVERIGGFEVPHFNWERNRMVGKSPFKIKESAFGWRRLLPSETPGLVGHAVGYLSPGREALHQLEAGIEAVLETDDDPIVFYIGGTDALTHFGGHEPTRRVVEIAAGELRHLVERHREKTGRCLRLAVLSDHGNTREKIRRIRGFRRHLRDAGFRLTQRLERPGDVVAPTFGLVSSGLLFAADDSATDLAMVTASHPDVELAAYRAEAGVVRVVGDGRAEIRWAGEGDGLLLGYSSDEGDPLELSGARARLDAEGVLDGEGLASPQEWLRADSEGRFPGVLKRLVDAFEGTFVENTATVVFTTVPGRAWGRRWGYIGARLRGGLLEGTHGGLDLESSFGFLLTNDPQLAPGGIQAAEDALRFLGAP